MKMVNHMDMENIFFRMEIFMKDNFLKVLDKVKEF